MAFPNFIFNKGEGKKNKLKIVSTVVLTIFLLQAITMANISNNQNNKNIDDLIAPIDESPDIETIEIEELPQNDLTPTSDTDNNLIPDVNPNNELFSKISSYQGTDLNNNIFAQESFTTENSVNNVVLQNSFEDLNNIQTTLVLDLPSNEYLSTSHTIAVENTKASLNHEHIEYENSNYNWLDSSTNLWQSVATSFVITEPVVNITTVRLAYLKFDSGNLQGEAFITNIVSGKPGTTKISGQSVDLTLGGGTNSTLSFPQPVTLTAGTYAVVLTETSPEDDENIFRYKYVRDDEYGDLNNESQMWQKSWGGSWASVNRDLYFSYEYLVLNSSDYSQAKQYLFPTDVNLLYNMNGDSLEFTSALPVTFDLYYTFSYESNNVIELSTSFNINNDTLPMWTSTFTHPSSPSGFFTISSRVFTISNLPLDWKAISLFQNGNIYSSDPDNDVNIIYTNGSSVLSLMLGQDTNAYTWMTEFISPNYIEFLTLKENDLNILNSPYKIASPNTLRIIANMDSTDGDSNGSLFIFDPTDLVNHYETDVITSSNSLTFNIWDPSVTLNLNEDNSGIYSIVITWIDASLTKIGFFETTFELMTQTNLSGYTDSPTYSSSENIYLTANFSSIINGTILDSADITYVASWDASTGVLTQTQSHGLYTTDISATNAQVGSAVLTVYASLEGYVSKSITIPITITQENSLLNYTVNGTSSSNLDLHYQDSIAFTIYYTTSSEPILSATVKVNGSIATEELDGSYTFNFETSTILYASSFVLVINANKTSFLSKELIMSFTMEEANSKINLLGDTPENNSEVSRYFSQSSFDLIELQLQYSSNMYSEAIQNALLTHNASASDFSIAINEGFDNVWIIQLNPETTGVFTIVFTFYTLGYQQLSYVLSIQVQTTPISFVQDGHSDFYGIESIISATLNSNSYETIILFVTYYDAIYNEILSEGSLNVWSDGINVSILVDKFENGTYSIQLSPLGSGIENITIAFGATNYQSSTMHVTLKIQENIENEDDNNKFCELIYIKDKKKNKFKIKQKLCKIIKKKFDEFKHHKGWYKDSSDHNKYYYEEFSKATPFIHDIVKHCNKYKHH